MDQTVHLRTKPEPRQAGVWPWLVILCSVAFVVYSNLHRLERVDKIQINDIRIKVIGQETIGLKSLQDFLQARTGAASLSRWNETSGQFIRGMESSASTPEHSFRIAVIAGEIRGNDEAIARLDTLSKSGIPSELADDIAALRKIYADGPEALDSEARERLIRQHDFFGRVALTHGLDPNREPRKSVEQTATRMLILVGLVAVVLLLFMVLSIGLLVIGIVLLRKGKIQAAYVSNPSSSSAFLEVFALYLTLFIVFGLMERKLGVVNLNWNWLSLLIMAVTILWAQRRGVDFQEFRRAVGWHCGRGWLREIAAGIGGYAAGWVLVALGLFITAILVKLTGASAGHPFTQILSGDGWHVLALYGIACVFAPVLEETMFRGALFHHMRRRRRWLISAAVVASVFATIHPQGWVALPPLGMIAMVLAALREWRGSIIAPMAAHALNNFIAVTVALLLLR